MLLFLIWKTTVISNCCIFICYRLVYFGPLLAERVAVTEVNRNYKNAFMSPGIAEQSMIYDPSVLQNLLVRRVATLHPSSAPTADCFPTTTSWYLSLR